MFSEVFKGRKSDLRVEERPLLSGNLPGRGDIFGGSSNKPEVLHLADILRELREQNPSEQVTI